MIEISAWALFVLALFTRIFTVTLKILASAGITDLMSPRIAYYSSRNTTRARPSFITPQHILSTI